MPWRDYGLRHPTPLKHLQKVYHSREAVDFGKSPTACQSHTWEMLFLCNTPGTSLTLHTYGIRISIQCKMIAGVHLYFQGPFCICSSGDWSWPQNTFWKSRFRLGFEGIFTGSGLELGIFDQDNWENQPEKIPAAAVLRSVGDTQNDILTPYF